MSRTDDTAKHKIYRELRRSIIVGHRKPGDRLSIETLADNYGTSVTPVRDALQMLSQEGLVTIKPRSGYFVTRITLKQLRDLLELREILEVASVERAATQITDEQLEELKQVHAGYSGDDDISYERYTDENRCFHCIIARASGNQELESALGHIHDRLARYMVLGQFGKTMEQTHELLIKALSSHDVELARQTICNELADFREAILDSVIREEGEYWHLDQ